MIELDPSSVNWVPIRIGISGICFNEKRHYIAEEVSKDLFFNEDSDNKTPMKAKNILMIPLWDYQ